MAYQDTDYVWNARGLHPTEKLILLRIADGMNPKKGNVAWWGMRRLAKDTGLSLQTLTDRLRNLMDRRLVYADKPTRPRQAWRLWVDFEAVQHAERSVLAARTRTKGKPRKVSVLSRTNLRSTAQNASVLSPRTDQVLEQVVEQVVRTPNRDVPSPERSRGEEPNRETQPLRELEGSHLANPPDGGLPANVSVFPGKRNRDTGSASFAKADPGAAGVPADWYRDCQERHGGLCKGSLGHRTQLAIDAERARTRESVA